MGIKDFLKNQGLYAEDKKPSEDTDDDTTSDDVAPVQPLRVVKGGKFSTSSSTPIRSTPIMSHTVVATPDEQMVNDLQTAVDRSAVKGYPEFKILFDSLEGVPDAQRFPAALKALQVGQKIPQTQVLQSLDDRLSLLETEHNNFEAAYQSSVNDAVIKKQKDSDSAAAQVEQLRVKIQELQAQQVSLAQEAAASQLELDQQRAIFAASYEEVRGQLEAERSKIAGFTTSKVEK